MGAVGDEAWHGGRRGAARRGMGAPSRGGLGRADNAVKKRGVAISIGCRNIDGVDRGESVGAGRCARASPKQTVRFFLRFRTYVCSITQEIRVRTKGSTGCPGLLW
jgi:hypothetical protein